MTWIVCLSTVVAISSLADAAINDPIKEINIKATATYTTPCNGNTDRVRVKDEKKIKGTRWDFKDATKDTARIGVLGDTLQEEALWKTTFDIENRGGIGATYVLIGEYVGGGGTTAGTGTGKNEWEAYAKDNIAAGTLVLKDENGGYSVGDYAALGPPPPDTLGCDIAVDGKGDVKFWLHGGSGTYDWTIVPDPNPDVSGDDSGTWTGTPYEKTIGNVRPGMYTLTVTKTGFERKIKFTVCYGVYLTFDDGPRFGTDDCIAVLKAQDIQGTFFMIGVHMDTAWYKNQVKSANSNGNLVGNHSYSHWHPPANYENPPTGKTNAQWEQDFANNDTKIAGILGHPAGTKYAYARLPGKNAWRIGTISKDDGNSKRVADHLASKGYKIFGWDVLWQNNGDFPVESPSAMVTMVKTKLLNGTSKRPGQVIVLMHDRMFRTSKGQKQKLIDFVVGLKNLKTTDNIYIKFKRLDGYVAD